MKLSYAKKFMTFVVSIVTCFEITSCNISTKNTTSLNQGDNVNYPVDENNNVIPIVKKRNMIQPNDNYQKSLFSYYDDDYNYYIYEMGKIVDSPLEDNYQYFPYFANVDVSHKFATTTVESSSIQSTTQKSFLENTTITESKKGSLTIEFGEKDVFKVAGSFEYAWSSCNSTTKSLTQTYTAVSQFSKSSSHEVSINLKGCDFGYYRYILVGVVDVYLAVVQSRTSKTEYYSYFLTEIKAYGYCLDYDKNSPTFSSQNDDKFEFDSSILESTSEPTYYVPKVLSSPITQKIISNSVYCPDNNGYSPRPNDTSDDATRHKGFDMGEFILEGCINNDDGTYSIISENNFKLDYHVLQYPKSLPNNGTAYHEINSDSYIFEASKLDSTLSDIAVKKGIIYAKCFYKDGTSKIVYIQNDYFSIHDYDSRETIVNSVVCKNLLKIELSIFYETHCGGPGFLGIYWQETPNWRSDVAIFFNNK